MYYYSLLSPEKRWSLLESKDQRTMAYYLNTKSDQELIQMLGPEYRGPQDRASMLFAGHTGYVVENISYPPQRYQLVRQVHYFQVAWLANYKYKLVTRIDGEQYLVTAIGPYRFIAAQDPSLVDDVIFSLNPTNVRSVIDRLGINIVYEDGQEYKAMSLVNQWLTTYGAPILTRAPGLVMPLVPENASELKFFTDRELIEFYEFTPTMARAELISFILANPKMWSDDRYRYASNADQEDIIELEPRRLMYIKPNAIVMSYGRIRNYQAWTIEELIGSFEPESDGSYLFRNPTGNNVFFSIESIRGLQADLQHITEYPSQDVRYKNLLELVNSGLKYHSRVGQNVDDLKRKYSTFTTQEQSLLSLYIFWLFTFGQYARFWKGPGNPYQYQRLNFQFHPERQDEAFCTPTQRNILSQIQYTVYQTILHNLSLLEHANETMAWVKDIPLISYNIVMDEAVITVGSDVATIDELLNKAAATTMCMMFTSDTTLETSMFLARRILNQDVETFNVTLRLMLPILRDIEVGILTSMIGLLNKDIQIIRDRIQALDPLDPDTPNERRIMEMDLNNAQNSVQMVTLQERLRQLSVNPLPYQIDFDPTKRVTTGENDPYQRMRTLQD